MFSSGSIFLRNLSFSAVFFQGQVEQPVRSLTSLLTHEDIPVIVAVNANGVYVIDDTESVSYTTCITANCT